MKLTSPPGVITSGSLVQRARRYRLAAAVSDAPRDVKVFLDLATMFELLSQQFARAEMSALASSIRGAHERRVAGLQQEVG